MRVRLFSGVTSISTEWKRARRLSHLQPLDYADLDGHEPQTDEQKIDCARSDQPARHAPSLRERRQRQCKGECYKPRHASASREARRF